MVEGWLAAAGDHWLLWALYLAAALEAAGLPLPYEGVFVALAVAVEAGKVSLGAGLSVLWLVNLLGNLAGYGAGRKVGRKGLPLVLRRWRSSRAFWRRWRKPMRSRAAHTLFVARWVGFGFGPALWMAGIQRLSPARLLAVMAVTNGVWVATWGLFTHRIIELVDRLLASPVFWPAVAGLIALLALLRWLYLRRRTQSRPMPQDRPSDTEGRQDAGRRPRGGTAP